MKTCPACREQNTDDAGFCIFCGASLAHAPAAPASAAGSTVPGAPVSQAFPGPVAEPLPVPMPVPVASAPGQLAEGALIDNKYRVERLLGEGGMGVVYLARDIHTQMPVVIKAIRTEYAHRQEFRDRILAEGRSLARIDHPNVVRLNAVVVEEKALVLVMQFIEGESLEQKVERHVKSRTPMPVDEVLRVFRQVLEGVEAAHREGVIHRDLKPANILIRARDGTAKVTDFGIAKAEEDAKAGRGQTRGIIGSLLYMAPEQITGRRDLDKRVDIYALGILLFELLVGRVPFDAPTEFEIMKLHLEAPIPNVHQMRADVPPFVDTLLQRACAKDREQRFSSAQEFLEALDRGVAQWRAPQTSVVPAHVVMPPMTGLQPRMVTSALATTAAAEVPIDQLLPPPKRSWLVPALIAAVLSLGTAMGGFALAWTSGWIGPRRHSRPSHSGVVPSQSSVVVPPTAPPRDAAVAPAHPLAALAGAWKSDTGREFDAVLSGNVLEFRIRKAEDFARQNYVEGEARFSLSVLPGESRTFAVEDKIRPTPPEGKTYDPLSRPTCQEVWSSVDGKPLRAQYDGTRLTIDMVKIVPSIKMFEVQGSRVVGCKGLKGASASKIESTSTRL